MSLCAACNEAPRRPNDSYCMPCRYRYNAAWRRSNPEKMRSYEARRQRYAHKPQGLLAHLRSVLEACSV